MRTKEEIKEVIERATESGELDFLDSEEQRILCTVKVVLQWVLKRKHMRYKDPIEWMLDYKIEEAKKLLKLKRKS